MHWGSFAVGAVVSTLLLSFIRHLRMGTVDGWVSDEELGRRYRAMKWRWL